MVRQSYRRTVCLRAVAAAAVVACLLLAPVDVVRAAAPIESTAPESSVAADQEVLTSSSSRPLPEHNEPSGAGIIVSKDSSPSPPATMYQHRLRRLFVREKTDTGRIKLKWGKSGHGIGTTIDVYEPPHHDGVKQQQQAEKNAVVAGAIAESSSSSTENADVVVDPVVYYCTHVAMCNSLISYADRLSTEMEHLLTYAGMIDECRDVDERSDPVSIEFCADARKTWEEDAMPLLRVKEYVEGMATKVCEDVDQLYRDAVGPLKITEESCADGAVVPQECRDGLTVCSDGTVTCGGALPYSCPKEDDCSTYCDGGVVPCVCAPPGGIAGGSGTGAAVVDMSPREDDTSAAEPDEEDEERPSVIDLEEKQEEELQEEAAEVAEEVDEVVEELTAVELEIETSNEIEALRAKIAELEAMEAKESGGGRGKRNLLRSS